MDHPLGGYVSALLVIYWGISSLAEALFGETKGVLTVQS
jgi:hypothetical protein